MIKHLLFIFLFLSMTCVANKLFAQWSVSPQLEYKSSIVNENNIGLICLGEYSFPKIYSVRAGAKYAMAGMGFFFAQGDFMWNVSESKKIDCGFYNKYIYSNYFLYNMQEFTVAIAGKLRTRFFDVSLGVLNRTYWDTNSIKRNVSEQVNFLYEFEGRIFGNERKYNLALVLSNTDDFYIERIQYAQFKVLGNYKLNNHVNLFLGSGFMPAGFFHLSTNYHAWFLRSGVDFKF